MHKIIIYQSTLAGKNETRSTLKFASEESASDVYMALLRSDIQAVVKLYNGNKCTRINEINLNLISRSILCTK